MNPMPYLAILVPPQQCYTSAAAGAFSNANDLFSNAYSVGDTFDLDLVASLPLSFWQGLMECDTGETVDLNSALFSEPPPESGV